MMMSFVKGFITLGVALILIGLGLHLFGKIPGVGRFPGDILIKNGKFTVFIPITTCFLISLILSFLLFLWNQK